MFHSDERTAVRAGLAQSENGAVQIQYRDRADKIGRNQTVGPHCLKTGRVRLSSRSEMTFEDTEQQ